MKQITFRKGLGVINRFSICNFHSADVDNLLNFSPVSNDEIYFPLEFEIVFHPNEGGSLFSVMVVTPQSLKKYNCNPKREKTKYLVVQEYNWPAIEKQICDIVEKTECNSGNIAPLLQFFNWEYE